MSGKEVEELYAESLLQSAVTLDALEQVVADMRLIRQSFETDPTMIRRLYAPTLSSAQRRAIIDSVFVPVVHSITCSFLRLVVKRGRLNHLSAIAELVLSKKDKLTKTVTVMVRGAVAFAPDLKGRIEYTLNRRFGGRCIYRYEVAPDLIAGFCAYTDEVMIDSSMKSRLEHLKTQMLR